MTSPSPPGQSRIALYLRGTPTIFKLLTADAANLAMFIFAALCLGVGLALLAGIGPIPPILLPFGVSAALLAFVILRVMSITRFFRRATPVAGRVTDIIESGSHRGGPDEVLYEYVFAGNSHTGVKHLSVHDLQVGQEITVYVDPASHEHSRILEAYSTPVSSHRSRRKRGRGR